MDFKQIQCVDQPKNINVKLFPHQLATIYQMQEMEKNQHIKFWDYVKYTKLGILADIAGYGKTISVLGLLSENKMEWDVELPFIMEKTVEEANGLIKKTTIKRLNKLPCNLILVSTNIVHQWEQEINKTNLKYVTITKKKDIDSINIYQYDIILVINSVYNNLIKTWHNHVWKRFIFDEPGHVRVSGMNEVKAGFYWFITATPNAITNFHQNCRGSFIKNIIGDVVLTFEEQFSGLILRNDPEFIKLSFNMPPTNQFNYQCFSPLYNTIKGLIDDRISIMIQGDNIEGAINALGGKNSKNIVELVKRRKLEELAFISSKLTIYELREEKDKFALYTNKKEKIQQEITELEQRFEQQLGGICSICMDSIKNPVLETNCQNIFCGKCLLEWMVKHETCPLCRKIIYNVDLIHIQQENTNNKSNPNTNILLQKNDQIIKIIKENINNSFLIFSDYHESFGSICSILNEHNLPFLVMQGNYKERENIITRYKNGDVKIIFINSHLDCAGINLENTTDIILYHEMSEYTKKQIVSRAERIGRTCSLNIHQLYV